MATYKVIQDIEAEDKFVGPLTLKQFIFAAIMVVCLYLSFILITKNLWPATFVLVPPAVVSGFLAFPWKRDQPTETWLIAKLRFFFKPRKRVWDQSGIKELVTITAPKKIEKLFTNGLEQDEVQSRLQALANTIDSRGWAIKNVGPQIYNQPAFAGGSAGSDRLIDPSVLQQNLPAVDDSPNDILDANSSPVARQLTTMMDASAQNYRQQLFQRMQQAGQAPVAAAPQTSTNPTTPAEQALLNKTHQEAQASPNQHLPTLQPVSNQPIVPPAPAPAAPQPAMTTAVDPAILGLAKNDDLNVATIARQAQRETEKHLGDDEVVISLR